MGATLLFWGWQTGFLLPGAVMALILESSRVVRTRWEFTDDEFARVWTFCVVLFLAALMFAFNDNGGPSGFSQLFENLNATSEHNASNVSTMTVDAVIRWLPMIFFLFIAAQTFSPANGVPLEAISIYLRSRLKRARKKGHPVPPSRRFNLAHPYFALCLFSAAGHTVEDNSFYFGLSALVAWALWPHRSRRFALPVWIGVLLTAIVAGFFGQRAFGQLSRLAEEYDPQLLSFFMRSMVDPKKSFTDIGDTGSLKLSGRIIIRLDPLHGAKVPMYLREASYRELDEKGNGRSHNRIYKQLVWETGNTNDEFPQMTETPPESGIFPLHSEPANRSLVTIACYLNGINRDDRYPEGVLPLPPDCSRIENSRAYFIYQNNLGTVVAEGPRLMIFDACYGSGMIQDDAPETDETMTNEDLAVPPEEVPGLDKVISQLHIAGNSEEAKIQAVSGFFADHFRYSLEEDNPLDSGTNATALSRFLLETHSGHCEYFATATVLLLRELGIPARYAIGYYVHEPAGHGYVVRLRDGHAWCLVWNTKTRAWENFDTTPSSWVAQEEENASPFQFLSDFQSWAEFQVLKFFDYSHNNIREYIFWPLIPALAFLLYRIFRGSRRHREGTLSPRTIWPGLDSEFYQLEERLARGGLPRQSGEPLSAWLQRATTDAQFAALRQPLENILRLHYRYRFDPSGLSPAERQTLRREVETCLSLASQRLLKASLDCR